MHEFAGYNMPIEYSGIIDEHLTVCHSVGVFDVSHMGEFWVKGPHALEFIQEVTSNNAAVLTPGKVQYTCFPNETGGIVDDLLVYAYEPEKYMLVVNAANIEKDWNWCVAHNRVGAELENSSDRTAQLAIQGPKAQEVLQRLTPVDLSSIPYYSFVTGEFAGCKNVIISNTGYTGAGGFELYFYPSDAMTIWNAIFEAGKPEGIKPIGLGARDTLRLEMGFCLYGNDIDEVDQLVVDVYNIYIDEMKKYPNTRYGRGPIGGIRYAGTSSISANVGQGYGTMATPDGRKAHTPLAEGCSPAHAMDKKGPTAVFKSVSKLPTHEITGGVLLNQKVTPQLLSKEENKEKIEMLIKTFFNRLKGYHVQYNVVSKETLLDAQAHPEKHKDLIVRVAGYSAFFNVLSKATQDDIIGRTEQTL